MTWRAILMMLIVFALAAAGIGLLLGSMAGSSNPLSLDGALSEPLALVLAGVGMGAMMLRRCTLR